MIKLILTMMIALIAAQNADASVRVYNSSGTNIGTYTDLKMANGLSVSQVSGKAQVALAAGSGTTALSGFLSSQTSTSGDLVAADCGKTVSSDAIVGAAGDIFNLPAISSALLGCRFTFIAGTTHPSGINVNPNTADKILILGSAAGDAITADAIGESIVLEAISPGWAPVGKEQGTWTDSN